MRCRWLPHATLFVDISSTTPLASTSVMKTQLDGANGRIAHQVLLSRRLNPAPLFAFSTFLGVKNRLRDVSSSLILASIRDDEYSSRFSHLGSVLLTVRVLPCNVLLLSQSKAHVVHSPTHIRRNLCVRASD